jgi:hypothetical protein
MIWNVTSTFHVSNFSKQTNIIFSHSFVQFFAKKSLLLTFMKMFIHFHFSSTFSSKKSFIHEHMAKYPSISPNILSHVSNNIFQILCWHQQNIPKKYLPMLTSSCSPIHCSRSHVHKITSLVYLWSMCGLLVIVINNISSIIVLILVAS